MTSFELYLSSFTFVPFLSKIKQFRGFFKQNNEKNIVLCTFKVADRRDVLPPESWFEDEDCELLIRCWKWQRCGKNLLKFSESPKEMEEPAGTVKWSSYILL